MAQTSDPKTTAIQRERESAQVYAVSFDWGAPAHCPSRAAVIERARELSETPFVLTDASSKDAAIVRVRVLGTANGFDVNFGGTTEQQPFTRQLHTSSCQEAAEATALLLAMMVQSEGASTQDVSIVGAPSSDVAAPTEPVPTEPVPVEQAPAERALPTPLPARAAETAAPIPHRSESRIGEIPEPEADVEPRERVPISSALPRDDGANDPSATSEHHWVVGAAASANHAVMPSTALGVVAQVGYDYHSLRFAIEGAWIPSVDQRLRSDPAIGAYVSQWHAALRTSYRQPVTLGSIDAGWLLTLAGEVGVRRGRAYGTEDATTRSALWLAAAGGGGALVKISPTWTSVLLVEALLPITRTEFNLRNVGVIQAPSAVGSRVRLGLEAQF